GGEVEDAAVGADHEVAVAVAHHAGDRFVELGCAHGAPEGGVEGEDSAVGGDEPVAVPVAVGDEALHWGVEPLAAHRTGERRVAEGEDAAVAGDHEVSGAGGSGHRPEDRTVEFHGRHVAEEGGVAEGEDPSPVGEDPVSAAVGRGRKAGRLLAGGESARRHPAMEGGGAEGIHGAGVVEDPVPVTAGDRFEVDGPGPAELAGGIAEDAGVAEGEDLAGGGGHPVPGGGTNPAGPGSGARRPTAAACSGRRRDRGNEDVAASSFLGGRDRQEPPRTCYDEGIDRPEGGRKFDAAGIPERRLD